MSSELHGLPAEAIAPARWPSRRVRIIAAALIVLGVGVAATFIGTVARRFAAVEEGY